MLYSGSCNSSALVYDFFKWQDTGQAVCCRGLITVAQAKRVLREVVVAAEIT